MNDLRSAFRGLRRSPAVAALAVTTLGLGIGATTAIFSVANAVMLRSLAVHRPDELVVLRYVSKKGNIFDSFDYGDYTALRDAPGALTGLAALSAMEFNLSSDEATERVPGQLVTGNYFPLLGVRPRIGRLLGPDDDLHPGGHPVCVIGHGLWQRRFGSSPEVLGRQIQINGRPYSIVGVTAANFAGVQQGAEAQVYIPLMMAAQVSARAADPKVQPPFLSWTDWLQCFGRRAPNITRARAEAALDARFAQLPAAHRTTTFEMSSRHGQPAERARLLVVDGRQGFDDLRFGYQRPLTILLFLVTLLLLIVCANVANLLLARAAGRRKEIAIRIALGGGAWALVRQLLAESLLLASGGALCGLTLALWMPEMLLRLASSGAPRDLDVQPDWTVAAFLLGITCLTAFLFGLAPALASVRTGVAAALKNEGGGSGKGRRALGGMLVVAQVALSVTLLAGAGLLLRTLHNLRSIQPGFRPENVVLASLNPGSNRYTAIESRALFQQLMERAGTIPGVQAASAALVSPLSGNLWLYSLEVPGYRTAPGERAMAYFNAVGPGYFASIGAQLKEGREFTRLDRQGAPVVAVVNEAMARKFWPGRSPLGQRFQSAAAEGVNVEVVGVVRDSVYRDLRENREAVLYLPLLQGEYRSATLDLRVAGDVPRVFGELRSLARQIDHSVPLYDMRTLEAQIAGTFSVERMLATISTLFGALAMLLAAVGLYGVLAYSVAQRSREIGIRMALGAGHTQVVGAVVRQTLLMVAVGVMLGLPASLAASKWIAGSLYGLKPGDPLTYGVVIAVLCAASLAAAIVPSRRAARVDPMVVLRCD